MARLLGLLGILWLVPEGSLLADTPLDLKVQHAVLPVHPENLRKFQVTGSTEIECTVAPDGRVAATRVLGATHQEFGDAGLQALKQWVFEPSSDHSVAPRTIVIIFSFILNHERAVEALVQRTVFQTITEPIVPTHQLATIPMPRIQLIPLYPEKLVGSGRNGRAVVSFVIGKDGRVLNPRVLKATFPELAVPSLRATIQLEYAPPRDAAGRPVYAAMEIQYSFTDPKPPLNLPWRQKKRPGETKKPKS